MMMIKKIMVIMIMMVMKDGVKMEVEGVDLNAKGDQVQPPQEIIQWILKQAVKPRYDFEGTWHTGTVLE